MTGPRKRTKAQDEILRRIALAATDERSARIAAEAEARELIETRIQQARDRTTTLIYKAHHEYGVTKAAITTIALGSTNFQATKNRIDEYVERMSIIPGETIVDAPEAPSEGGLSTVQAKADETGSITVRFRNYTHEDIGTDLNGTVSFHDGFDGTATVEEGNEALREAASNPLWPLLVADLEEVQAVL